MIDIINIFRFIKVFKVKVSRGRHVRQCKEQVRAQLMKDGMTSDEAEETIADPPGNNYYNDFPKIRDKSKTRQCPLCKKANKRF